MIMKVFYIFNTQNINYTFWLEVQYRLSCTKIGNNLDASFNDNKLVKNRI